MVDNLAGDTLTSVSHAFTFSALFITGMGLAKPSRAGAGESGEKRSAVRDDLPAHQESVVVITLVMGKSILFAFLVRYATAIVMPEASQNPLRPLPPHPEKPNKPSL